MSGLDRSRKRAGKGTLMRARAITAVLFSAAALLAGCGGSSATSSTSSSATTKAASAPAASSSSAAAPSFTSLGNCQQLAGVGAKFAQAMAGARSGGKFNFQAAVTAYQNLANAAPSAIRPDVQVMAQLFSSFAGALSKVGYTPGQAPSPTQLAGLQTAVQLFSQPKVRAAEQHLTAWAHQNCT